jgi:hypothetical protein
MRRTIEVDIDPKTIGAWARAIGVSRSVLCECCRLVHVSPIGARDCARMMRAIYLSGPRWQPENVLDLLDARTLRKLLTNAGLPKAASQPPTVEELLARQRWIPDNNPALIALRALL